MIENEIIGQLRLDSPGLRAKEHTAQVPPAERQEREREFSDAGLPVLYCSPTMELGVDINALSAVGLRNVPPTPANYAQRAGRAGRSGQPALVVTYCATGNAHDQYYFRRPTDMVGGAVAPPRLDLANEDLVRSHIHAIWLAGMMADLAEAPWWRDGWIDDAVKQAPQEFDEKCTRWRDMYRLALQEFHT